MSPDSKENELYAILPSDLRDELKQYEQSTTVPEGTTLIDHDILQEYLVILNSGSVRVTVRCPQNTISFITDQQGKVFGMPAVISGELPELDLTCMDSCNVTMLPRTAFLRLLKSHPELYFAVAKVLSADVQMANRILRDYPWRLHASRSRMTKVV